MLDAGRVCCSPTSASNSDSSCSNAALQVAPGAVLSKFGTYVPSVHVFDAAACGLSPAEAALMDPQQRILLEESAQAVAHSGRWEQCTSRGHGLADQQLAIQQASQDYHLTQQPELPASFPMSLPACSLGQPQIFLTAAHHAHARCPAPPFPSQGLSTLYLAHQPAFTLAASGQSLGISSQRITPHGEAARR